ncbi:N utilization substance protein B [Geodermatophilus sp. Leaf369]|uniref:transcription antitermination factor NusB n=1 Tax=Geodermatophilus sp. Leaf369 TaxID=1736354 RepID=UPI0006F3550D|nr:transcription antitermination factor NusB [Geodermatophilus sp. Leaf369]KQS59582.1 N utilization substance protein B [Geodermatophilus sp. Leaf369]QNG38419.1 transcription antitermination factor NusB [Geodermatophilaceae bacterium NBWT11]
MAARSKARKRAVDVLYEADLRSRDVIELLRERVADSNPPVSEHAVRLVEGAHEHATEIDRLIGEHADGWTLDRLPDVDRAILRMAVFELLWVPDVPDAVVIDEAVELAKALSTDDSSSYVNGVLGGIIRREIPTA